MTPEEQAAIDHLLALPEEEAKQTALSAIQHTGFFDATPASQLPHQSLDPRIHSFFSIFQRLTFTITGEKKPFFVLDQNLIGELTKNPGAVQVGTLAIGNLPIAVHLPTGRVVCGYYTTRVGGVAKAAASDDLASHSSLWHFIAWWAAKHKLGLEKQARKNQKSKGIERPLTPQ